VKAASCVPSAFKRTMLPTDVPFQSDSWPARMIFPFDCSSAAMMLLLAAVPAFVKNVESLTPGGTVHWA